MALQSGVRVGVYEVVALVGEGGMGEVYRARDTRLGRDVALKVLAGPLAADADRLARLQREAQPLAALNHPNIAHIYGLEESDGQRAPVLEFVDGPTLADRLARGPMPLDEAIAIARQIVDALEAAHEQGIVHRDLKPANIKLRPDGTVKVLDFGLAKAITDESGHAATSATFSRSPTITTPAMTLAGVVLGTAAYMAPEQAKGRPADKRSDVWAFGCVLYEMLSGRRAFAGDDVADTLAFVLTKEPDWAALPPDTPDPVRKLLRRCLEKDRRRRLADVADARLELDEALAAPAASATVAAASGVDWFARSRRLAWTLTGIALIALAALRRRAAAAAARTRSCSRALHHRVARRVDARQRPQPVRSRPCASRRLAGRPVYHAARAQCRGQDPIVDPLPGRGRDARTARHGRRDWSVLVARRPVRRLLRRRQAEEDRRGRRGGDHIVQRPVVQWCELGPRWDHPVRAGRGNGGPIFKLSSAGGDPMPVTTLEKNESFHIRPSFLPDGRHFFYRSNAGSGLGSIYVASLDSPERRVAVADPDASNVTYADGYLLLVRDTTPLAQPFDLQRLQTTGDPAPVTERVQKVSNYAMYSSSDSGVSRTQQVRPAPRQGRSSSHGAIVRGSPSLPSSDAISITT